MHQGVVNIVAFVYLFLASRISGRQFVSEMDRLVSGDLIDGLPDECMDDFEVLHEKMSLCVWDKRTYDESPGLYIDESELRTHVEVFINKWGKVLAELVCKK